MNDSERHDPIQGKIVHEYDGILEADNQLPRWWLATFFGTVVFAGLYWFAYSQWHFAMGPREEYMAAMEAAAASGGEVTDEMLGLIAGTEERVASGHETFEANCAVCHGHQGEGNIGPNLTDSAWIHGGAPTNIYQTVREGVGTAGMPAWGPVLGERQVQSVVAFVLSIRDTNVAGRPPQGEVWVPGGAPAAHEVVEPAAHEAAEPSEAAEGAEEPAPAAPAPAGPEAAAEPAAAAPAAI